MSDLINLVNEYLSYCDKLKTLIWIKKPKQSRVVVGDIAGLVVSPNGVTEHYRIGFMGKVYFAHKLAWMVHHKCKPPKVIDHIDGNGLNNSKENISDSSLSRNNKNKRLHKKNKLGIHGICHRASRGLFEVTIGDSGNVKYVGSSSDFFEACCLRKSQESKLGYSCNHGH